MCNLRRSPGIACDVLASIDGDSKAKEVKVITDIVKIVSTPFHGAGRICFSKEQQVEMRKCYSRKKKEKENESMQEEAVRQSHIQDFIPSSGADYGRHLEYKKAERSRSGFRILPEERQIYDAT